eukprot:SAG11_NODE_1058_length_6003_cov_1.474424_3_plen_88_part_00
MLLEQDLADLLQSPPKVTGANLFQWDLIGADVTYLFVEAFVYLGLVMLVDYCRNFPALINKIPGMGEPEGNREVVDYDVDPGISPPL